MSKTKSQLLKRVALVAITITSIAVTSGVAEAGSKGSAPEGTSTTTSTRTYDGGSGQPPATRAGIRW
jgi:hypothetical protein